ncbi:MAG: HEAT repeat domain-containing protein [Bacteroidetes bacterium]|nr:MAG: HEAT repeat domain-containing protein [Bacteroidota bacterium]
MSSVLAQPNEASASVVSFIEKELEATDLLIKICIVLIILFIVLFISFFITLMVARTTHRHRDHYEKSLKEKYELLLTGIIFNDEDDLETEEFLESKKRVISHFKKHYLHLRKNRAYLREHILLLHKNFAGTAADVLRKLYIELKLDKEAIRELNSPDWGIQANAVKELAQLGITAAAKKIKRRTQHENHTLRIEAQVASIILETKDRFSFLGKDKNVLTEWHQLNLSQVIDKLDAEDIPQFKQWFSSTNDSVVQFCIKMTLQFDQFESTNDLINLLKHPSQLVVGEAAKVLGEFGATDADVALLNVYRDAENWVKIRILNALGKCGTHEIIPFLQQQLLQNDIDIAFEAGKALRLFGNEGIDTLKANLSSPLYGVSNICQHLLDERI